MFKKAPPSTWPAARPAVRFAFCVSFWLHAASCARNVTLDPFVPSLRDAGLADTATQVDTHTSLDVADNGQPAAHFAAATPIGRVQDIAIVEPSGLAASRQHLGVLWTHNDSIGEAELFALDGAGQTLGVYRLDGASNRDWEDIAVGPGPTPGIWYIYLADMGTSAASPALYRVPEPEVRLGQAAAAVTLYGAERLSVGFPPGVQTSADGLMVDPRTADVYVGVAGEAVYRIVAPTGPGPHQAQFVARIALGAAISGADWSADHDEILIKSRLRVAYWRWADRGQQTLADLLASTPLTLPYEEEAEGEAISWAGDGSGYFTLSEEPSATLYFYPRRL